MHSDAMMEKGRMADELHDGSVATNKKRKKSNTSTWKSAEKEVSKRVGGERINGARGIHIEDVSHHTFSIEVKHGRCIPKFVTDAYAQCVKNAPEGKVPLVVMHQHRSTHYMATLPLDDLIRLLKMHNPEAVDTLESLVVESSVTEVTDN